MQEFRKVSRTRTIYSTETHTSHFILNTFWNGKSVQFFQERCWVVVTGCQENKSCNKVLNFLERLDDRIMCTSGKRYVDDVRDGRQEDVIILPAFSCKCICGWFCVLLNSVTGNSIVISVRCIPIMTWNDCDLKMLWLHVCLFTWIFIFETV